MFLFFFFNDTATTEIYTLSLHDALPISLSTRVRYERPTVCSVPCWRSAARSVRSNRLATSTKYAAFTDAPSGAPRSEEHTSELQSRLHLVCRLLLEKKKNNEDCLR